jgi:hypothetical protein
MEHTKSEKSVVLEKKKHFTSIRETTPLVTEIVSPPMG